MFRKISAIAAAAVLLTACGCSSGDKTGEIRNEEVSMYVTSDGEIVYDFGTEEEFEEFSGDPESRGGTKEVTAPTGSISIEQAEKIVDDCSFKSFYLPGKTAEYKKYCHEIINEDETSWYHMYFYLEKNGVRLYTGTDFRVSCDGKSVTKRDWTGSYQEVKTGSASGDPTQQELFPGAKTSPEDAVFAICNVDAKRLGLTESLQTYLFETDDKLCSKKSIDCYKITPKLIYPNGIKMCSPIYIAADGTDRILMTDQTTGEISLVQ